MDKNYAFNDAIRQKLDHEHSVMSNRTGWHHAIQIAMFVGFYSIETSDHFCLLKIVLPIIGVLYAFSAIYSCGLANRLALVFLCIGIGTLKYELCWEKLPPVFGDPLPHIINSEHDQSIRDDMNLKCKDILIAQYVPHWFMLYRFIPLIFIIIWAVCFIEILYN